MSGIGSTLRRHWIEIAWGVFSIVNLWVIVLLLRWETIPFHLIWVSLTLLYGFRVWRPSTTTLVLSIVMLSTGLALTWTVLRGNEQLDEVTEVPLMAAMFVAMAVHAHRRQRAVEAERRSAATVRRVLERQRGFVRDASHELRTPITVARGHAELLRGNALDERSARDADVVLEELDRLSQLSERLLTLASADHPGFLTFRDVVVEDLVAETLVRWGPVAPREWRAGDREGDRRGARRQRGSVGSARPGSHLPDPHPGVRRPRGAVRRTARAAGDRGARGQVLISTFPKMSVSPTGRPAEFRPSVHVG
jgi:signal transduction histidine kinase